MKQAIQKKQAIQLEDSAYAFLEVGRKGLRKLEVTSPHQGYRFVYQPGLFWTGCLNTVVSQLGKKGIVLARHVDPYIRPAGGKAHYMRYYLADQNSAKTALNLLNQYRVKRGVDPLPDDLADMLVKQFPEPVDQAG